MKNLVKLFTVIALLAIGFSATAQVGSGDGLSTLTAKQVALNSVRSFTVVSHATSNYAWTIENADGGTVVTSTTDLTAGASDKNVFFVKWVKVGDYKVTLVETSKVGNCSNSALNTKVYYIKVIANDFFVTPTWDNIIVGSGTTCAVGGDNTLNFTVTKVGGKAGVWKFEYKISKSYDNTNFTEIKELTEVIYSVAGDNVVSVTTPIALGYDKCYVKFEVINARDGYNTPANVLPVEVLAVVNQIPETSIITID